MAKYKEINFPDLLILVNELREVGFFDDNHTLNFATDRRGKNEPTAWWGIIPVSMFEDDTYLVGYHGGGSTEAIDLTDYETSEESKEVFEECMKEITESDTVWLELDSKGNYK